MFFIILCYFLFQYLVIVSASRYSHSILDVTKASFIIRDKSCFLYHLVRTPRDARNAGHACDRARFRRVLSPASTYQPEAY